MTEKKELRAYYGIRGISPVEKVVTIVKEEGHIKIDGYEAKEQNGSVVIFYRKVEDFKQAKPYKSTLSMEGATWVDCAKFLCTLRKRGYSKPSIYWMNFSLLKMERISYQELYDYLKEYNNIPELVKNFKKTFCMKG